MVALASAVVPAGGARLGDAVTRGVPGEAGCANAATRVDVASSPAVANNAFACDLVDTGARSVALRAPELGVADALGTSADAHDSAAVVVAAAEVHIRAGAGVGVRSNDTTRIPAPAEEADEACATPRGENI